MTDAVTFNAKISIFSRYNTFKRQQGHRMVMVFDALADVPAELFATKILSQSSNPERNGRRVFKYMSYKNVETGVYSDIAPDVINDQTPLTDVKQMVIDKLDNPQTEINFGLNMPGNFANINTPAGRFQIFDLNNLGQPAVQPNGTPGNGNTGDPDYYLKSETPAQVTLTPATNQGNAYFQVELSTDLAPDDIFQRRGANAVQVWGQENDAPAFGSAPAAASPAPAQPAPAQPANPSSVW